MPPTTHYLIARGPRPGQLDIGVPAGNTATKSAMLAQSTLIFNVRTQPLQQIVKQVGGSGSAHLDKIALRLGEGHLGNMLARNASAKAVIDRLDLQHPDALKPETVLKALGRQEGARPTKLFIEHQWTGNHYAPKTHSAHLAEPKHVPYAAHELRHALDHVTAKMDLKSPAHRLASELNAFGSQQKVAEELGVGSGLVRTPLEMARTYEGKDTTTYPGTIESSQQAVTEWRQAQDQLAAAKKAADTAARRAETSLKRSNSTRSEG